MKVLSRFSFSLILLSSLSLSSFANSGRTGLAKKFSIPPLQDSHIVVGQTYQEELNPQSIKVLVWNLLKAERPTWSEDFMRLSEKKDILMLQEGYLNPVMESTFDQMYNFRFDFGVSFLYDKDNFTPTGSVIGSRATPTETGILRTTDLEPFIKTPKTMTYAKYPVAGFQQKLLAITIHGMNFTKDKFFENQVDDACRLISRHRGPVIFAGDFNTRNRPRMAYLRKKMQELDIKEVTFRNDKRKSFLGVPLDHAFARGLLVRDSRVVTEVVSSDHKALEIDFALDTQSK